MQYEQQITDEYCSLAPQLMQPRSTYRVAANLAKRGVSCAWEENSNRISGAYEGEESPYHNGRVGRSNMENMGREGSDVERYGSNMGNEGLGIEGAETSEKVSWFKL